MAIFEVTFAKPHDFMGMIVSYSNKLRLEMEIEKKIRKKRWCQNGLSYQEW